MAGGDLGSSVGVYAALSGGIHELDADSPRLDDVMSIHVVHLNDKG